MTGESIRYIRRYYIPYIDLVSARPFRRETQVIHYRIQGVSLLRSFEASLITVGWRGSLSAPKELLALTADSTALRGCASHRKDQTHLLHVQKRSQHLPHRGMQYAHEEEKTGSASRLAEAKGGGQAGVDDLLQTWSCRPVQYARVERARRLRRETRS